MKLKKDYARIPFMKMMNRLYLVVLLFSITVSAAYGQNWNPLQGLTIMLDPGHGGADPGAVGPNGLKESVVNLRVSRYLARLLEHDGATVLLTRDDDVFVSLGDRVARADTARPDLFISIHHNASLAPKKEYKGEIYFNAVDEGIPLQVARAMTRELSDSPLASGSLTLPGGFFVLRNNRVPAILTEASYLSVPENAKALSTGRSLVEEAVGFRDAIRKAFRIHPLQIKFFATEPCLVTTPFFHLLLSSSRPISHLELNVQGPGSTTFKLDRIPSIGNMYSLINQTSLPTGDYQLTMTFTGRNASISGRQTLALQVRLPPQENVIRPVAPFIPRGFCGAFPVQVALMDFAGRPNCQALAVTIKWEGREKSAVTNADGRACLLLDLTGQERGNLAVLAESQGQELGRITIPVRENDWLYVLGRTVTGVSGPGLENVRVKYGPEKQTVSGPGGYFFCGIPGAFRNLTLELVPPLGYQAGSRFIQGEDQRVVLPEIVLPPLAPKVLGKHFGLIVHRDDEESLRFLVRNLMQKGARITRMLLPEKSMKPESLAVAQANSLPGLEFLLTFKTHAGKDIVIRHYHKGGRGLNLARAIKTDLKKQGIPVVVQAGSDYEISHSSASAIVLDLPGTLPGTAVKQCYDSLARVLETGW